MCIGQGPFFVGVDAGGTRTRAVCISAKGELLGRGVAGAANHATGDPKQAKDAICGAIRQAMSFQAEGLPSIAATFIGSAGLEYPGLEVEGRALLDHTVYSEKVYLDSDAYVAWAGAFRCQPGIILIAGTGSMCLGIGADGRRIKVGGWGWRVGDEGSAYSIAINAIRAALQAADGRRDAALLWDQLQRFVGRAANLGAPDRVGNRVVRAWLYAPERRPAEIASFAPFVEQAYAKGCLTSAKILDDAGKELASMVAVVTEKLAHGFRLPVAVVGGVIEHNALVRESFEAALCAVPYVSGMQKPKLTPELGAALLAMRTSGARLGPQLFRNLERCLRLPRGKSSRDRH